MQLLEDFKNSIGYTGSDNDTYFIDRYLKPVIDIASSYIVNIKKTEVQLVDGVHEYDLSDTIHDGGVERFIYDGTIYTPFRYRKDFYFKDRFTLYIIDAENIHGEFAFKYNAYFKAPSFEAEEYVESDIPDIYFPDIIDYAKASYTLDQILNAADASTGVGIEERQEADIRVKYGPVRDRISALETQKKNAVEHIKSLAGNSMPFFSVQVV